MKKRIIALLLASIFTFGLVGCGEKSSAENPSKEQAENETQKGDKDGAEESDANTSASADATTSASIVPKELVQDYSPKGFTDSEAKKALFVIGDPRKESVNYDLANTAMKYFEENGIEVEKRDLYDMKFNPVLELENFYYAKDGKGEPTPEIKTEQEFVTKADYIIFCYPNWHDTPNAIVKGYMETVFAKQYAYQNTDNGLEGMLKGKSIFTIMNAGFLGGGRGYIGDGVGIDDTAWDSYMNAFKVLDDDTAAFWGVENKGRFVNDRTPKNDSENYQTEVEELRNALKETLKDTFLK